MIMHQQVIAVDESDAERVIYPTADRPLLVVVTITCLHAISMKESIGLNEITT